MSQTLPASIRLLLTELEGDIGGIYADSTLSEFWIVFAARAARIRSLGGNDEVRLEVTRQLDAMVARLNRGDRRKH